MFVSFALVVRLFRVCFAFVYLFGVGSFRVCLFLWHLLISSTFCLFLWCWRFALVASFVSRFFIHFTLLGSFRVVFFLSVFVSLFIFWRWSVSRLFFLSLFIYFFGACELLALFGVC